jgi:hypothetical protein
MTDGGEEGTQRGGGPGGEEEWLQRKVWLARLGWRHGDGGDRGGEKADRLRVGGWEALEERPARVGAAAGIEDQRWREDVLELGETGQRQRSCRSSAA